MKLRESLPPRNHGPVSQLQARACARRIQSDVRDLILQTVTTKRREEISALLDAFFDAGDGFAESAKDFDEKLQNDGIFQALRNVWIVNSLQVGFGVPVQVNPSAFAYSLLYTYTDNFLDDLAIPESDKVAFGASFGRRLSGLDVDEDSAFFSTVSELVRRIEEEYPRSSFSDVYASLLEIHRAQQASLLQRSQFGTDILSLSVRKGGTSVLADGYIAKGALKSIEQEFSFGYGVFLQLLDDLQDVEEDLAGASETLFTHAARAGTLDEITFQLAAFIRNTLESVSPVVKSKLGSLAELVLQSCNGLIVESIALHPDFFSADFARQYEVYSPLSLDAIRSLHKEQQLFESDSFVGLAELTSADTVST